MRVKFLPLKDQLSTWVVYAACMAAITWVCFDDLADLQIVTHDTDIFRDNEAISEDFSHFFSAAKAHASGRPTAEWVKWLAYLVWGNDPRWFHLLVVATHLLASLSLAWLVRRMGCAMELSLLGGLLFLVNVVHYQAVHWISAFDYPLALVLALGAVLCYQLYLTEQRLVWLGGVYGGLILGVLSHMSVAAVWLFCLYWAWYRGHEIKAALRPLLPLALALAGAVLLSLSLTTKGASTWRSIDMHNQSQIFDVLLGLWRPFLWLLGRLLTAAHFLPLNLHEMHPWELYVGAGVAAGLAVAIWKRSFPGAVWAVWTALLLLPFLLIEIDGPDLFMSRYVYLASAGSSLLLAWLFVELARSLVRRTRRLGRVAIVCLLVGLGYFNYTSLKRVEAISLYDSGVHYIAAGDLQSGVDQLRRAIAQSRDTIPLDVAYSRLCAVLPYLGEDPAPELEQAVAEFPHYVWLHVLLGARELLSDDPDVQAQGQDRLDAMAAHTEKLGQSDLFANNVSAFYHNWGKGFERVDNLEGAIGVYQRALEFKADRPTTLEALRGLYARTGRGDYDEQRAPAP